MGGAVTQVNDEAVVGVGDSGDVVPGENERGAGAGRNHQCVAADADEGVVGEKSWQRDKATNEAVEENCRANDGENRFEALEIRGLRRGRSREEQEGGAWWAAARRL